MDLSTNRQLNRGGTVQETPEDRATKLAILARVARVSGVTEDQNRRLYALFQELGSRTVNVFDPETGLSVARLMSLQDVATLEYRADPDRADEIRRRAESPDDEFLTEEEFLEAVGERQAQSA